MALPRPGVEGAPAAHSLGVAMGEGICGVCNGQNSPAPEPSERDAGGYIRLIVRMAETSRPGDWLSYDKFFRQKAAAEPHLSWTQKRQTFSRPSSSPRRGWHARHVRVCGASDHKAVDCALRANKLSASARTASKRNRDVCRLFNDTSGGCRFGANSIYRHACEKCGKGHRAADCKSPGTQQPTAGTAASAA